MSSSSLHGRRAVGVDIDAAHSISDTSTWLQRRDAMPAGGTLTSRRYRRTRCRLAAIRPASPRLVRDARREYTGTMADATQRGSRPSSDEDVARARPGPGDESPDREQSAVHRDRIEPDYGTSVLIYLPLTMPVPMSVPVHDPHAPTTGPYVKYWSSRTGSGPRAHVLPL